MKTSARKIALTTAYCGPTLWSPWQRTEGNGFFFPDPQLVFRDEGEETQGEQPLLSLLSQLYFYEFQNKNQYFIQLELRPLLQQLHLLAQQVSKAEQAEVQNLAEGLQTWLGKRKEREKAQSTTGAILWKEQAGHLLEKLQIKEKTLTSAGSEQKKRRTQRMQKKAGFPFQRVQGSFLQKKESPIQRSSQSSFRQQDWQQEMEHFFHIFDGMPKAEQASFLQTLSTTESQLQLLKQASKPQWEDFLAQQMPLIASYVKAAEKTTEKVIEKTKEKTDETNTEKTDIQTVQAAQLRLLEQCTKTQWQQMKEQLALQSKPEARALWAVLQKQELIPKKHFLEREHTQGQTIPQNWAEEKTAWMTYIKENPTSPLWHVFLDVLAQTNAGAPLAKALEKESVSHPFFKEGETEIAKRAAQTVKQQEKNEENIEESSKFVLQWQSFLQQQQQKVLIEETGIKPPVLEPSRKEGNAFPLLDEMRPQKGGGKNPLSPSNPQAQPSPKDSNYLLQKMQGENRGQNTPKFGGGLPPLAKMLGMQKKQMTQISPLRPLVPLSQKQRQEIWRKEIHRFFTLYEGMEETQQEAFLQTLSITEGELLFLKQATKPQWEEFLGQALPLISTFVKTQEAEQQAKQMALQKEQLCRLERCTQTQWQWFKEIWTKQQETLPEVRAFFQKELAASSQSQNSWLEEKQRWIDDLEKTQSPLVWNMVYKAMGKWEEGEEKTPFFRETKQPEQVVFAQNTLEQLGQWISFLDESQWQEVKTTLEEHHQERTVAPLLELVQNQTSQGQEPLFSAQKRAFFTYLTQHEKESEPLLQLLWQQRSIRESLSQWVTLPIKTRERKERQLPTEKATTEGASFAALASPAPQAEEGERALTLAQNLAQWISFLDESRWQEVKTTLEEHHQERTVAPLLELVQNQKPQGQEPLFSAQKRAFFTYLTQHEKEGETLLQLLWQQGPIRESLSQWVTLPIKTRERKERQLPAEKAATEGASVGALVSPAQQTEGETALTVAQNLAQWISFLNESQWQEVKNTLEEHRQEVEIAPLLELVQHQTPQGQEPLFSAQKRGAITYLAQNTDHAIPLARRLMEEKRLSGQISQWVALPPAKTEGQEKATNQSPWTETMGQGTMGGHLVHWMAHLTKPQMDALRNEANSQGQIPQFQPLFTFLEQTKASTDFSIQKQMLLQQVQEQEDLAASLMELEQENQTVQLIFQQLRQEAAKHPLLPKTDSSKNPPGKKPLEVAKELQKAQNTLEKLVPWVVQMKQKRQAAQAKEFQKTQETLGATLLQQTTPLQKPERALEIGEAFGKDPWQSVGRGETTGMVSSPSMGLTQPIFGRQTLGQRAFLSLAKEEEKTTASDPWAQMPYQSAQLVVAKKPAAATTMAPPAPSLPDVVTEVKKTVQTQVQDILTKKSVQEESRSESSNVSELLKRIESQQKEIETIRKAQSQLLKVTDISVVTEKVMYQMQNQLRLEKMRRGL